MAKQTIWDWIRTRLATKQPGVLSMKSRSSSFIPERTPTWRKPPTPTTQTLPLVKSSTRIRVTKDGTKAIVEKITLSATGDTIRLTSGQLVSIKSLETAEAVEKALKSGGKLFVTRKPVTSSTIARKPVTPFTRKLVMPSTYKKPLVKKTKLKK